MEEDRKTAVKSASGAAERRMQQVCSEKKGPLAAETAREQKLRVPWAVYLLQCADGTLYCGVTTDVLRRIAQHNGEIRGGARYTASRRPVRLAAWAPCVSRSAALRLEAAVRRRHKEEKTAFLLQTAQRMMELSAESFFNDAEIMEKEE